MKKVTSFILVIILCFATICPIQAAVNYATKSADIAQSYVGKTKSDLGYKISWCSAFVCKCVKEAGVSRDFFPYYSGATQLFYHLTNQWYDLPKKYVCTQTGSVVTSPRKGDLIFYKSRTNKGYYAHVGIMFDSVKSVQGNVGGKVSLLAKPTNFIYTDGIRAKASEIVYVRINYSILQNERSKMPIPQWVVDTYKVKP